MWVFGIITDTFGVFTSNKGFRSLCKTGALFKVSGDVTAHAAIPVSQIYQNKLK